MITNLRKHRIIIIIVAGIMIVLLLVYVLYAAFFSQWGERGWSKIANITIAEEEGLQEISELEGVKIYTCNLSEVMYLNITADEITLEDYIKQDWAEIENLLHGEKTERKLDGKVVTVYSSENYDIVHLKNAIVFMPRGLL